MRRSRNRIQSFEDFTQLDHIRAFQQKTTWELYILLCSIVCIVSKGEL